MVEPEFHQLSPRLWVWRRYDPAIKTELFSTALQTAAGVYLVDPTPLTECQLRSLFETTSASGVIITNANHARSAVEFSQRLSIPVFAAPLASADLKLQSVQEVGDGAVLPGDLEVIQIPGAASGEIALRHSHEGGTLIVGDALINFEPYGFTLLPRKYCENQKQMRLSLRKLLDSPAERLLFAHGVPILSGAGNRLQQLLAHEA